tara:strand:+ start:4824 stop:5177 length:354 start_codon:yes stop_codon:yes gene_type:complete
MFVIKVYNKHFKKNVVLDKTINNLISLVKNARNYNTKIIKDSSSVEIISGNLNTNDVNNEVVVELAVKKIIRISEDKLSSKSDLDKFIKEIESFCDQASEIEEVKYLPLNFRVKNSE